MRPLPLFLAIAALGCDSRLHGAERPNVLFLMSDDMRPDLGCYGHPLVKSPNLDALAARGVRFDRAYAQYPLCNPSRTSMLTGRYPTATGVMDNRSFFGTAHPDYASLPAFFKRNGYATLRSGKIFHEGIDDTAAWTEGGEPRKKADGTRTNAAQAEDRSASERRVVLTGDGETHSDYKIADKAIEYLRAHKGGPFFLACGFVRPHVALTAPKKYYDLYDPATIPLPADFAPTPTVPPGFPKDCVPALNIDLFAGRAATPAEARLVIQAYWASVSWTDSNIGRVLAELDKLGLRDNTVVVFWGDHGYHLGEKGKWSKHRSLFEVGTRIPLIVAAPGQKGNGKASARTVQALDLYPTLCGLCGLTPPAGLEGHDLAPLLADPGAKWDHPAVTVSGNAGKLLGVAVRDERFRYAEYVSGGAMLFDEAADPGETKNLADDPKYAAEKDPLAKLVGAFRK